MRIRHDFGKELKFHTAYIYAHRYFDMARKAKYFAEVKKLFEMGAEVNQIVKLTNIPHSTVYRIIAKLSSEATNDFQRLVSGEFLLRYFENMKNISKTIFDMNVRLENVDQQYTALENELRAELAQIPTNRNMERVSLYSLITQLHINKSHEIERLSNRRDKASEIKAKLLNDGPVAHAINILLKDRKKTEILIPMVEKTLLEDKTRKDEEKTGDVDAELEFNQKMEESNT